MTVIEAMQLAVGHLNAGRLAEAAEIYRLVLEVAPTYGEAHANRGLALARTGNIEEAIGEYQKALKLLPLAPEIYANLAAALRERGSIDQAIDACREALRLQPDYLDALNVMGNSFVDMGKADEAIGYFSRAAEVGPDRAEAFCNLGNALRLANRAREAEAACRRAIALRPDFAEAYNNLGTALHDQKRSDEGIAAFGEALRLRGNYPDAWNNLGTAFYDLRRQAEAEAAYRRALALSPDHVLALNNLGNVLQERKQPDEAIQCYREALKLRPHYTTAMHNLGMALTDVGQLREAIDCYTKLGRKDDVAQSHRLQLLPFLPEWDGPGILGELRAWGDEQAKKVADAHFDPLPPRKKTSKADRLRIGYVTADFWAHVAGRNSLPLLREHDRNEFEVYCYSNAVKTDELTEKFRAAATEWRNIRGMDDRSLAKIVREDGIDILVDLAVHTTGNRLPMFAHKPAPVQVTFCGYPGGTGLTAMDYRLTDPYLDPPGADGLYVEKSCRLPHSFWCYDVEGMELTDSPQVNGPPVLESGRIMFGCLNHPYKINEELLTVWNRVLDRVPKSRIMLLALPGSRRKWLAEQLEGRVEFEEYRPRRGYFELYHHIDIGLDSFPYNGHTTSLDSFWMGVPIVTLAGKTAVGRGGWSQLSNLKLPELAGQSVDEYVSLAVELANNVDRQKNLRMNLRDRMKASPLMDASGFARDIEAAYRQMRDQG